MPSCMIYGWITGVGNEKGRERSDENTVGNWYPHFMNESYADGGLYSMKRSTTEQSTDLQEREISS